MITIEQVEKLKEKTNVSYEEAKAALEAAGGDLLEAVIYLERNGKAQKPENGGYYSSEAEKPVQAVVAAGGGQDKKQGETFAGLLGRFLRWLRHLVVRGNLNSFRVLRGEAEVIAVPVTVLALLLIFAFWVTIPLMVVGLFFGYRYLFQGPDLGTTGVNQVMDSAADAAESIKKEIHDGK